MPKAKTKAASANIYAVLGSDEGEVKRVAAELASNLTPAAAGDFGLETIDGAADNADQAEARVKSTIEALQTLPFFGSTKVVWLKNVNFLGDDQKARSAAVQSMLEELSELIDSGFGPGITAEICMATWAGEPGPVRTDRRDRVVPAGRPHHTGV